MLENSISELEDDWLSNAPPSLEDIYIDNNNIKNIGSNVFSKLNSLKELKLEGNRFGPIKRSMLPNPADRLSGLYLG